MGNGQAGYDREKGLEVGQYNMLLWRPEREGVYIL